MTNPRWAEARLAEVEAERDTWRDRHTELRAILSKDRARLAAVEAERDEAKAFAVAEHAAFQTMNDRRAIAEARLAAVEALCQRNFDIEDWYEIDANDVIAAVRGEGDG